MNEELTEGMIALLRASPIGAAMGGRIFPAANVPPDLPFPRCMVQYRTPQPYIRYSRGNGIDRIVHVAILFATTTQVSSDAQYDIEHWDLLARAAIEWEVTATGLISFLRTLDEPSRPQNDDRTTYLVGGGVYEAHFQEPS